MPRAKVTTLPKTSSAAQLQELRDAEKALREQRYKTMEAQQEAKRRKSEKEQLEKEQAAAADKKGVVGSLTHAFKNPKDALKALKKGVLDPRGTAKAAVAQINLARHGLQQNAQGLIVKATVDEKTKSRCALYMLGGLLFTVGLVHVLAMAGIIEDRFSEKLKEQALAARAQAQALGQQALGNITSAISGQSFYNETSAEPVPPPPPYSGGAAVSAVAGAVMGPVLLCYGFRAKDTIVVLNALVASGMNHFFSQVQNMGTWNEQASGGRFDKANLLFLGKVLLSSFSLAVSAMRVSKFGKLMRGGVSAMLVFETVINQIPPQFGCACDGYPCNDAVRSAAYELEVACYEDRWLRFGLRYTVVLMGAFIGLVFSDEAERMNMVLIGANLCNQVIFDSALARNPEKGSSVQPYRMLSLFVLGYFGFKVQSALEGIRDFHNEAVLLKMEAEEEQQEQERIVQAMHAAAAAAGIDLGAAAAAKTAAKTLEAKTAAEVGAGGETLKGDGGKDDKKGGKGKGKGKGGKDTGGADADAGGGRPAQAESKEEEDKEEEGGDESKEELVAKDDRDGLPTERVIVKLGFPPDLWCPMLTKPMHRVAPAILGWLLAVEQVAGKLKNMGTKEQREALETAKAEARIKIEEANAAADAAEAELKRRGIEWKRTEVLASAKITDLSKLQGKLEHDVDKKRKEVSAKRKAREGRLYRTRLGRRLVLLLCNLALVMLGAMSLEYTIGKLNSDEGWGSIGDSLWSGIKRGDVKELDYASRIAFFFCAADVFVILTGLIGICASVLERPLALLIYATIMFFLAVGEFAATGFVKDAEFIGATQSLARDRLRQLYTDLGCTAAIRPVAHPVPYDPPTAGLFTLTCAEKEGAGARWLQGLTQNNCDFVDARHINATRWHLVEALERHRAGATYSTVRVQAEKLEQRMVRADAIGHCVAHHGGGKSLESEIGLLCICEHQVGQGMREIMDKVSDYAIALGVLEAILCLLCLAIAQERVRRKFVKLRGKAKVSKQERELKAINAKIDQEREKLERAENKHLLPSRSEPAGAAPSGAKMHKWGAAVGAGTVTVAGAEKKKKTRIIL